MNLRLISFTARGEKLAERLSDLLGGECCRCGGGVSLDDWTREAFARADALVYVGAVGIAVRAVAPYVSGKDRDPAVVVVDELGLHAIPILSGHLGGANSLARKIADAIGAEAVITTATDLNGVFAVDEWARLQNCAVLEPEHIKEVSGRLLAGEKVTLSSSFSIAGEPPEGMILSDAGAVHLGIYRTAARLHLVPKIGVLGVGCKRGTPAERLETAFQAFSEGCGLLEAAVVEAASIDLKAEEPGLQAFCARHGWPLTTYSAPQLEAVPGEFTPSPFVRKVTGVDNVCERSAVLCSGGGLERNKFACDGVTFALALKPFAPDWRWRNG